MRLLFQSFVIVIVFSLGVVARPILGDLKPEKDVEPSPRVSQFSGAQNFDLILFGDSLTDHGRWSEMLDCDVANRGIGRDTVVAAKLRAEFVPDDAPIFVMLGINDLIAGRPLDAIVSDYDDLLGKWRGRNVVVVSVVGPSELPVNELNASLQELAKNNHVSFLDLSDTLGHPLAYTYDGVHLVDVGYARWARKIADVMGETCQVLSPFDKF